MNGDLKGALKGFPPRSARVAVLEERHFDLLVIGGGITGAAVARDAAARGLAVALVEKDDWACGTSSRSSKLIHGGLRYLASGDLRLVFESLSERAILARAAPHLVEPGDFLFPVYRDRGVSRLALEAGLTVYDLLSLGHSPRHRRLARRETLSRERLLDSASLLGASVYQDARTDDARLTLENVLDAVGLGAVAVSRMKVESLKKDREGTILGAGILDRESGRTFSARARVVVNATGPWADGLRRLDDPEATPSLRLSRGAHVTIPAGRLPLSETVAFPLGDGRLLFAIPSGPVTLLGTTETDHEGSLEDVVASSSDVDYLLAAARTTFPAAALTESDVLSTFAGLRPLVRQRGRSLRRTSREDSVERASSGLVTVTGGKLTTHRLTAERAVDRCAAALGRQGVAVARSPTRDRPFPGRPSCPMTEWLSHIRDIAASGYSGAGESLPHLSRRYGSRAGDVIGLAIENAELGRPLCPGLPDLDAEVVFAARFDDARCVTDVLLRRTHVGWQDPANAMTCSERTADLLAKELGWSAPERQASLDDYAREVDLSRSWRSKKML